MKPTVQIQCEQETWDCKEHDKQFKTRQSLRNHLKKVHDKIMCRCGYCTNEAVGGTHFTKRYCKDCGSGTCPSCGRGTRGSRY